MTQASRLAAMDARRARAFVRTGLADRGIYAAPNTSLGAEPNCTVMLDRNLQVLGEYGEVVGSADHAVFMLAEVSPARGGKLQIGSDIWTLEKKVVNEDESMSEWVLNRG